MKQVYSFRTGLEAHNFRFFLESHGIEARVFGDNNAFEVGFALTPATAPGVYVNEYDFERADALIESFLAGPCQPVAKVRWQCRNCGEKNEASFEICWRCEALRDESVSDDLMPSEVVVEEGTAASESSGEPQLVDHATTCSIIETTRPNWMLWIEVLIVLAVSQTFFTWADPLIAISPTAMREWLYQHWYINGLIFEIGVIAAVLTIMWWSREPLFKFGIQPFRPLWDFTGGIFLMMITLMVVYISNDSFNHFLEMFPSLAELGQRGSVEYYFPPGIYGLILLALMALSVGISEELVFRGYLIPRFEYLFGSTRWAVAISAFLFAMLHLRSNLGTVWQAFILGLIFGTVFVRHRNLWPLAIAHASIDYVVFLRDGS